RIGGEEAARRRIARRGRGGRNGRRQRRGQDRPAAEAERAGVDDRRAGLGLALLGGRRRGRRGLGVGRLRREVGVGRLGRGRVDDFGRLVDDLRAAFA